MMENLHRQCDTVAGGGYDVEFYSSNPVTNLSQTSTPNWKNPSIGSGLLHQHVQFDNNNHLASSNRTDLNHSSQGFS